MENMSRGPTYGDFVTILTEGSMQDNTVARLQSRDSPLPPLWNVMYCVRVYLTTVKIFHRSRVIFVYLWGILLESRNTARHGSKLRVVGTARLGRVQCFGSPLLKTCQGLRVESIQTVKEAHYGFPSSSIWLREKHSCTTSPPATTRCY